MDPTCCANAADRGLVQGLASNVRSDLPEDLPGARGASCAALHRLAFSRCPLSLLPPLLALLSFVLDCIFFSRRRELHLFSPSRTASSFSISSHTLSFLFLPPRRGRARIVSCPSLVPTPRGVGGAPGGALSVRSRLRGATTALARRGPSRAIGTAPRGAPPWRFSARDPRRAISDSARRMRAAPCPLPGRMARRAGSRTSRGCGSRRSGGRHSPLRLQDVSGDAPHERGWVQSSLDAYGSQYRSHS